MEQRVWKVVSSDSNLKLLNIIKGDLILNENGNLRNIRTGKELPTFIDIEDKSLFIELILDDDE